jgi:very-short-patch-repair endonuclease
MNENEIERRRKISEKMKENFKNGKIKGWSFINENKNRRSYPEEFFIKVFENNGLYEKYTIKEKLPYGKYNIDFLIVDLKLIIEIDGEQHYKDDKAIEHDKIRDNFFLNEGFKIYRIRWKDVFSNTKKEINELLEFIESNITYRKYSLEEIIRIKKNVYRKQKKTKKCGNCDKFILSCNDLCRECWKKSIKNDNYKFVPERKNICNNCGEKIYGDKLCVKCNGLKNRKVKRPSYYELLEDISKMSYSDVGKKYGVTHGAIKKWIKNYEKTETYPMMAKGSVC